MDFAIGGCRALDYIIRGNCRGPDVGCRVGKGKFLELYCALQNAYFRLNTVLVSVGDPNNLAVHAAFVKSV